MPRKLLRLARARARAPPSGPTPAHGRVLGRPARDSSLRTRLPTTMAATTTTTATTRAPERAAVVPLRIMAMFSSCAGPWMAPPRCRHGLPFGAGCVKRPLCLVEIPRATYNLLPPPHRRWMAQVRLGFVRRWLTRATDLWAEGTEGGGRIAFARCAGCDRHELTNNERTRAVGNTSGRRRRRRSN